MKLMELECDFVYGIMTCQHLEERHNSVNQCFPKDQWMIYKTAHGCKYHSLCKTDSWSSVLQCEKFNNIVSAFMLHFAFKKLLVVEFWCSFKENVHSYLKRLLRVLSNF